jgi:hypothetical protein
MMNKDEHYGVAPPPTEAESGCPKWICTGCAKITSSQPFGRCHDCSSIFRKATRNDELCDRCEEDDGKRLLDRSGDYDRLCEECIQELDLRASRSFETLKEHSPGGGGR